MEYVLKNISKKELIDLYLKKQNNDQKQAERQARLEASKVDGTVIMDQGLAKLKYKKERARDRYNAFIDAAKTHFLIEALTYNFNKCLPEHIVNDSNNRAVARNIITKFVHSNDTNDLCFKMKYRTPYLSSLVNLVEETIDDVKDTAKIDDEDTLRVNDTVKNDFFEKLQGTTDEEITSEISDRIVDSIQEFLADNVRDKEYIENILKATKDKIEEVREDETQDTETTEKVSESYSIMAKREISRIRNRPKTVLENMVQNLAVSSMTNNHLKNEFSYDGKLDMTKIVDRATIMYSFLEYANALKLIKMDSDYVKNIINEMKV